VDNRSTTKYNDDILVKIKVKFVEDNLKMYENNAMLIRGCTRDIDV